MVTKIGGGTKVSLDRINISVINYDKVLEFYGIFFGLKEVKNGKYGILQLGVVMGKSY